MDKGYGAMKAGRYHNLTKPVDVTKFAKCSTKPEKTSEKPVPQRDRKHCGLSWLLEWKIFF